jgi:Right handed beta helix region
MSRSTRCCESLKAQRTLRAVLWFLFVCTGFCQTLPVKVMATSGTATPGTQSEACTYYVSPTGSDSNSGTIQSPWRHLQKAFEALAPGQVACLRTGTYAPAGGYNSPSYRHTFSRTGEPGKLVVIRNYPGETAIVRGEVVVRGSYLKLLGTPPSGRLIFQGPLGPDASGIRGKGASQVWLEGCHNIVLDHIEIRNNDHHAGLYVNDVSDVQVLGCYVHDNGRFGMDTDTMGQHPVNVDQGIYWAASSGTNRIANCVLEHNRAFDLQLFTGSGRISGLTIIENTIVKAMNSGVLIGKGADGNVFAHNVVAMNSLQTNDAQIRLAQDARNNIIDTNIVWSATSALEGLDTSTSSGLGNVVRNLIPRDPLFVNFPGGDYHLRPGSPAIGASLWTEAESVDVEGKKRPSRPSLGAYEPGPPQ